MGGNLPFQMSVTIERIINFFLKDISITPSQNTSEISCNSEEILIIKNFINAWVYKEPSKFPVTIEG